MKKFNLSDWALEHRSLVWYFMIVSILAGAFSFVNLGREEDPSFTIKTMVIQAQWPGATAAETADQVTDRIEKKLQELPELHFTKSMTEPGKATIFVDLLATTKARDVQSVWFRVRNMINDIAYTFPQGVQGPFYQDTFGDVFGNIYAFTGDGLSYRQLRDYVEDARSNILSVPDIGKVDIIGAQDEVVYLEFSPRKLAAFGIDQQAMLNALQEQNAIAPSGVINSGPERIALRVTGQFTSEDSLRNINFHLNDRFFRLSDVANVTRTYVDPPSSVFRFNGKNAIALAVGMKPGANLLNFGKALDDRWRRSRRRFPSASIFIWSPTSRRSSRKPWAASPRRCSKPSSSFSPSASSASACGPAWSWRLPFRWFWPLPSWSWSIPASRCSEFRSAR